MNLKKYIEDFNITQNKEFEFLEKFPFEVFLPITEYEVPDIMDGYYISNYSRVYSTISKKIIKTGTFGGALYPKFTCACKNKKQKTLNVHRVLMMVFNPLDDYTGMIVNHIDGNKLNSFLFNLEWTDTKGNVIHARDNNLLHPAHGETHCCAKITAKQAEEVCKYLEMRMYQYKTISELTGVPIGIIHSIKQGKAWREISSKYNLNFTSERMSNVFTFEDIHNICKYFQSNPKDDNISLRKHCIACLESLNLEVSASNINSLRKVYKKERWKFICNNYNY